MEALQLSKLTRIEREQLLDSANRAKLKRKSIDISAITPADADVRQALSFAQQRLWFLAQMNVSEAYHMPMGLRLTGVLNREALRQALDRLVQRHEVLRTTFPQVDGEPLQCIALETDSAFALCERDLHGHDDAEGELLRLAVEEARAPFDFANGPLIRGQLIQQGAQEHVLLITMHHIVSDGWSMGVMVNELSALYSAYRDGKVDPLPPLSVQYADYAAWQRRWMTGEVWQQQADYWKATLTDAPALLEVPMDHARPAQQDYAGDFVDYRLDAGLTEGIKALSQRHGTTLFMTLLASWAALLAKLSGQEDVVIGTPSANRGRSEIEGLIGFFVNTLALRLDISGSPTVGEFLGRVKAQSLAAQQHQDIPFEQVVEIARPSRSLAHSPLFQAVFVWQNMPGGTLELPGLTFAPLAMAPHVTAKFDLTLTLWERGEVIEGGIEYATALFERSTIERYLGHWRTLLEAMVADDRQRVDRLPLLTTMERHRILEEWNDTRVEYPHEQCIHELFEVQVAKTPDAVAVVHEGQQLTYGELNAQANRLAHYLREWGVKPDDRVAICVERGPHMVVGLLAVLKAGGAYVPLDPTYPADRLAYMLEDSAPRVVLTQGEIDGAWREGLGDVSPAPPMLDLTAQPSLWESFPESNPDRAAVGLMPEHLAYVIYTSGSTGNPKGVMVEHANIVRLFKATDALFKFNAEDIWTLFHSYAFDFSVWEIWGALLHGGRLVIVPQEVVRSPESFYELLCRERVTILNQTPSAFRQVIAAQERSNEVHRLRYVIFGGEALEVTALKPWYRKNEEQNTRLVNMYGITETTVHVTYRPLDNFDTDRHGGSPIGSRIPDLKIYILDAHGQLLPVGVTGELYIGGAGVARGYLNRPELTAERFVTDPFSGEANARMYRTGDLGRWLADGTIEFLGRNDFQVKVRGFRIELGEIEACLAEHAGIREVVVLAREDSPGDKRLVAYITPSPERAFPVCQMLRMQKIGVGTQEKRYELPNGLMVFHQNASETEFVYAEVFESRNYLKYGITLHDGDCVFDVGANVGLFTLFVGQHCRNATIYAFEPIAPVFNILRLNMELYGLAGKAFEYGLAERSKQEVFTFYPNNTLISSSSVTPEEAYQAVKSFLLNQQRSKGKNIDPDKAVIEELLDIRLETEHKTCQLRALSEIIEENNIKHINLLKIDVEGSEHDVLNGIKESDWPKIGQLVIEIHDVSGRLEKIASMLEMRGYEVNWEQDSLLENTALYNLYAVHTSSIRAPLGAGDQPTHVATNSTWASQNSLIRDARELLCKQLPEYMVPSAFVTLDALPLTPNGKLDRKALPSPDVGAYVTHTYEAPQGETEVVLAEIWSELLKLDRVGRHDNFFELGGHSLLAVTLMERMRRQGLQIDVRSVFTTPTLAGLAATVGGGTSHVVVPPNLIPPLSKTITPQMLPLVDLTQSEIDHIVEGVPGGASNVQDIYPLAPLQEGILFHHLLATDGDPYLQGILTGFDSHERLSGYLRALQQVLDRHDILRTAVVWEGLSQPAQVVWRHAPLSVEEVVLDPSAGDVAGQLRAHVDPRRYRLDVQKAPLMRAYIARDAAHDRWLLLMLLHHLLGDHTTLEVMQAEIEAHLLGQMDRLPAPLPFRNLVAQARLGVSRQDHEAFFRRMLGEIDEPTAPFGLLEVQGDGTGIGEAHLSVDGDLARRLRERARMLGVSAASMCHLAWAQVLARTSGREDVVFGTVLFGRMQGGEGADRAMGMFINTLPVRVQVGGESVEASVKRTHAALAELLRHEHAPLALAQRCSAVPAPTPLFSALLNYRYSGNDAQVPTAETMQAWEGITGLYGEERTNYPLVLSVDDLGKGFGLSAQVQAPIEAMRICHFMHTALERLVEALEQAPGTAIRNLDVLPTMERHRILEEWNDTRVEYPHEQCIHELFEVQVAKTPDAVAVVHEGQQLTYRELNAQANRLAHYLREWGVKPDDRVAICVERGPHMVVGLLAVLKAGGAYVPLDPTYPADRLAYMLEDSAPRVVLTQGEIDGAWREGLGDVSPAPPMLDLTAQPSLWESFPESNPDRAAVGLMPEHLAYVIYTSGSTGNPKGVMVEHRHLVITLITTRTELGFGDEDILPNLASPGFDISILELLLPLVSGGATLLLETRHIKDMASLVERTRVCTFFHAVPSLMNAWIAFLGPNEGRTYYPQLRCLMVGGEAVSNKLLRTLMVCYPQAEIIELYGPTEAAVISTFYRPNDHETHSVPHCIGRRFQGTRTYLLDHELNLQPFGMAGELYLGGASIARGYLNRSDLTAERFLADPFSSVPGARMYRTGDLARYLPDGTIEFLGRNDFQVKVRGFRIELGEIEACLAEHAGIREVVVLAREDSPGDKRLVAYYVAGQDDGDDRVVEAEGLRNHLAARLPEYMVPAAYVRLDALPLTPNGKLDRKALPSPDVGAYVTHTYEAPQGETEVVLAEIWSELLKLDRVGRHDNFFELGGHSLFAVQVVTRFSQQTGIDISPADIFRHVTIKSLSAYAIAQSSETSDQAIQIRAGGSQNPLFLTHDGSGSLFYAYKLSSFIAGDVPIYGLPPVPLAQLQLHTVEAMADRMVGMIRAVQPVGPYRLAGWSFGGMLAYEIAMQLIGADQIVEYLGLIDTRYKLGAKPPNISESNDETDLLSVVRNNSFGIEDEKTPLINELVSNATSKDFEALVNECRRMALMPMSLAGLGSKAISQTLARNRAIYRAETQYFACQTTAPVHLYRSEGEDAIKRLSGWHSVMPDHLLHITEVHGDHYSMLESSNGIALGKAITDDICKSNSERRYLPEYRESPLVILQKGRHNSATLFCVPGAGDNAVSFTGLALALGQAWPVKSFQPRGVDNDQVPHSTVLAAAAAYAQSIYQTQPEGRIHLMGHSFGGWVAFETGQRLRALGRAVSSLTLIDTEAPAGTFAIAEYSRTEIIMRWVASVEEMSGQHLDVSASDFDSRDEIGQLELIHQRLVRCGLMSGRTHFEMLRGPLRTFAQCLRTRYVPIRLYPDVVRLVLLSDPKLDEGIDRQRHEGCLKGWREWAPSIRFWHGKGSHMTVLQPPYVQALADWFSMEVSELDRKHII